MSRHMTDIPAECPPAWGHDVEAWSLGHVREVPASAHEVADRLLVQESASRYALAYDERQLDVLDDLLTDDMVFAFSVSGGGYAETKGKTEVIPWLHDIMQTQSDQRRHVCGNFIVEELTSDFAHVTLYFALFASQATTQLVTTGFYVMKMSKIDGKWRINYIYDGLDRPF